MIVLHASDHGFGHAMRLSALAEHLSRAGLPVTLVAGGAAPRLRAAFERLRLGVRVEEGLLDVGMIQDRRAFRADLGATERALEGWLQGADRVVATEAERLGRLGARLVIADAPALACEAAARAAVPAVVLSNFTWLEQYAGRFGPTVDARLRAGYAEARLGLLLGPGALALEGVPRVRRIAGALSRPARRSREEVRRELGVGDDELLVMLGLGRAFDPELGRALVAAAGGPGARGAGVRLLVSSDSAIPGAVAFPAETLDSQDYTAAADLLFGKAGYSTCAEAARLGVPQLLFPLPDSAESTAIADAIADGGLGVRLPEPEAIAALGDLDRLRSLLAALPGAPGPLGRRAPPLCDAAPEIAALLAAEGLL